jgi:hypothetical protein
MKSISPLLFLIALALAPQRANASGSRTYEVEGWHVKIRQDQFSGATSCQIGRRGVFLERGLAVFQFNVNTDTSTAIYRIDNGPPADARMPASDRLTDDLHRLENPSHGEVKIALGRLVMAHNVLIRPRGARGPQRFDVSGLGDAVAFASIRHCPID